MNTVKRFGITLSILFLSLLSAYAEETSMIHQADIEHVEIKLPDALLKGFLVIEQPLTMNEAVEIGLAHNLDIQILDAEKDYRYAMWKAAKGRRWPTIGAGSLSFLQGGNSQLFRTPSMMMRTVDDKTFTQELTLFAKMPIYTGGQIRGGIKASRYAFEGANDAQKDIMLETAFQIRQAYLSAALAKIQHHIHQQHIKVEEELLRLVKAKYQHGKGLKADVLRVQAEVAEAQQHLNTHHNHLNNMVFELVAQMGVDLGSKVDLGETLKILPWDGSVLKELVEGAVKNHPKIQVAQKKIMEAKAQLKTVRSQYFPQVTGQVSGNIRLPENKAGGSGNGVVGLLTAAWPLFDRERDHTVQAFKVQLLKTKKEARNVELHLAKKIAQVWSEMTFARENVHLSEAAVQDAQEQLRLMKRRFEVGKALNVEVQDAILTLLQAQLNQAQAIFDHELAKAKLMRTTGSIF